MPEQTEGCAAPSKGPILQEVNVSNEKTTKKEEKSMVLAKVGKLAPDFELSAFHQGGFKNIKLSDYKGEWIVVCFYPGDFTFV